MHCSWASELLRLGAGAMVPRSLDSRNDGKRSSETGDMSVDGRRSMSRFRGPVDTARLRESMRMDSWRWRGRSKACRQQDRFVSYDDGRTA